jgi:hypothetical protein
MRFGRNEQRLLVGIVRNRSAEGQATVRTFKDQMQWLAGHAPDTGVGPLTPGSVSGKPEQQQREREYVPATSMARSFGCIARRLLVAFSELDIGAPP